LFLLVAFALSFYIHRAEQFNAPNEELCQELTSLTSRLSFGEKLEGNQDYQRNRVLVVEVSHGLGNRMRALASAHALAIVSNRILVVVWLNDVHLSTTLSDLFYVEGLVSVHKSYLPCALNSPQFDVYDYLKNPVDQKYRERIRDASENHIYVRTAFKIFGKSSYSNAQVSQFLRSVRPVPAVEKLIHKMKEQLWAKKGHFIEQTIGAHIRMQGDLAKDIPGILSLTREDPRSVSPRMLDVAAQRSRCHYRYFEAAFLARGEKKEIYFVTSDSPEAEEGLKANLGSQIFVPDLVDHKTCFGVEARSMRCVRLAFAEMLILSKTSSFYYSVASSFSEVIIDLMGIRKDRVQSGCSN